MSVVLSIFVHHGKNTAQTVQVEPNEQIQDLGKHIKLPKLRIVFFHNCMLLGAFTYSFYKVSNGDHLFVVPMGFSTNKSETVNITKLFLSRVLCTTTDKVSGTAPNPEKRISSFLRETSRIKDTFFQKMEGTMIKHKKTINAFSAITNIIKPKRDINLLPTIIPPSPKSISNDELPIIWLPSNANNVGTEENLDAYEEDEYEYEEEAQEAMQNC